MFACLIQTVPETPPCRMPTWKRQPWRWIYYEACCQGTKSTTEISISIAAAGCVFSNDVPSAQDSPGDERSDSNEGRAYRGACYPHLPDESNIKAFGVTASFLTFTGAGTVRVWRY